MEGKRFRYSYLNVQAEQSECFLIYAPALQRGEVQVIEDFVPISGVEIEVNVLEKVKHIYQIPNGKKLSFKREENKILVKVPTFIMHTGIVLEY